MSRTVTVPLGESATLTLLPPLSARSRIGVFGAFWSALDAVMGRSDMTLSEAGQAGLRLDAGAAAAVLQMQPTVSVACSPVERFVSGLYVDAGGLEQAVADLLDWCEASGIPTADLQAACNRAAGASSQPTAAAVETVRGN